LRLTAGALPATVLPRVGWFGCCLCCVGKHPRVGGGQNGFAPVCRAGPCNQQTNCSLCPRRCLCSCPGLPMRRIFHLAIPGIGAFPRGFICSQLPPFTRSVSSAQAHHPFSCAGHPWIAFVVQSPLPSLTCVHNVPTSFAALATHPHHPLTPILLRLSASRCEASPAGITGIPRSSR